MKELSIIQKALKAPKNQINKFGGYKYRSCEDILEAVKPLLNENQCTLTINDDVILIGNRYYIKAVATIKNANGEIEQTAAFAREPENKKGVDEPQITGTASSYARKYALNGLFAIDDTKDADIDEYNKQQTNAPDLPNPELIVALDRVKQCKTIEELQNLWYELTGWQKDRTFIAEVNKQKLALTNK